MTVKLLTEQHLESLSLNETTQARLSLHLSKCHIVGNLMSQLISFANSLDSDQARRDVAPDLNPNCLTL